VSGLRLGQTTPQFPKLVGRSPLGGFPPCFRRPPVLRPSVRLPAAPSALRVLCV